jgi:PPK2 family polyphosphate:nucleotide phosphotransferase
MTDLELPEHGSDGCGAALRRELAVPFDPQGTNLEGYDSCATPFESSKKRAVRQLDEELRPALFEAHELLMAHADRRVVLVLQGLDASGKSGAIKHVVSAMNPVGVRVSSFKKPTGEEEAEPFLARIERALPDPGMLAVFDRSHYEDAIVPAVRERESDDTVDARVDAIRRFEEDLVADGTVIVKCLLNLSYDEQRERFLSRLREPDKRWKFSDADLETRRSWSQFIAAYGAVIGRTSTELAPWHVIPADRKWYRNWAIAQVLLDVLRELHDEHPRPDLDVAALEAKLEPPH